MNKIELIKCSYAVPLDEKQWEKLNETDSDGNDVFSVIMGREAPEIKKLVEAGCYDFEWDGHFGRNFYFDCDTADRKNALKAVRKFIRFLSR